MQGHQLNPVDLQRLLPGPVDHTRLTAAFRVARPARYNMAADTVTRQAHGPRADAPALVCDDGARYTFRELEVLSSRLAAWLAAQGVGRGEVIACYCTQGLEVALAHLAAYKLGAIVAPLSALYGPDAVAHVFVDCTPRVLITQRPLWQRLCTLAPDLPRPPLVLLAQGDAPGTLPFEAALEPGPAAVGCADTAGDDPALLLYTSGSTGMPKGILHRQRILLGYLASTSLFYEMELGDPGRVLWTASDWSWVAGIFNVMLTGWYFGHTVLASTAPFSAENTFDLMARHGVTHSFLTPTALKRMAQVAQPRSRWPELAIRAIGTGGEPLPSAVLSWAREELAIPVNEFYGLTEVNHLVGNCSRLWPVRPGSMGLAYPGHVLEVVDEHGNPVPAGEVGEIVARADDPTLFLGYWRAPERTEAMRVGRWIRTGDFASRDADGYFWYEGRDDDLIKSAGYRIGPAEVEDALVRHAKVAEAAVVGRPDAQRGQIVKAFVRLDEGVQPCDALAAELREHVKQRLAFYKYPRELEFVNSFPLTSTGKINRKALRLAEQQRASA